MDVHLYRLAHGCTFLTAGDLFGVAASTAHCIFLEICNVLVRKMCDDFVYLLKTLEYWTKELQGFLENWEFPCVGACVYFLYQEKFLQLQKKIFHHQFYWVQ